MNSLQNIYRINELWTRFVVEVQNSGKLNYTDIDHEAQNLLVSLFKIIYNAPNLRNLDVTDEANYPGIDLADDVRRVAFQVSADSSANKIAETLEKFSRHQQYIKYDRLIVYVLTKKKPYRSDFESIVPAPFRFDSKKDIVDYTDILKRVKTLSLADQQQVLDCLELEFGEVGTRDYTIPQEEIDRNRQAYVAPVEFNKAATTLQQQRLVIITGPPHIGKSETGITLLRQIADGERLGNVLRFKRIEDWTRLLKTQNRAILLDDPFGATTYENKQVSDRFDDLRRLARSNYVVITSRSNVFQEALSGRMGEYGSLDNLTVELEQEGSYPDASLHRY